MQHVDDLPGRSYAVIIDEAHSSQTGDAAKELRAVLGEGAPETISSEDVLVAQVAGRGHQPNLSFFAFTATPKAKTLEMFGHKTTHDGEEVYEPTHLYSMRQAIEEKFIEDVLKSYTTYDTFYKIEKKSLDNPEVDPGKARTQIARYVRLHEGNLAQRSQIIIDHFTDKTAKKMRGRAKAMVVTSSREHAISFKLALDTNLAEDGSDLGVLVAFSGKIEVKGVEYTESSINGFPESQTARRFNRIHPDKQDTFVLDFQNDTDDIRTAFEPYYGKTLAIPTDPNAMGDAKDALEILGAIWEAEILPVVEAVQSDDERAQAMVYGLLEPARARFEALTKEQREEVRDALTRFINIYSFMSQIVTYTDQELENRYIYSRLLAKTLPPRPGDGQIDVSSKVELTHLKVALAEEEQDVSLGEDADPLAVLFGSGKLHEVDEETLEEIIRQINEALGRTLTKADAILFEQMEETWLGDDALAAQAQNNEFENFSLASAKRFDGDWLDRQTDNEELVLKLINSPMLRDALFAFYAERVYKSLREKRS
jgi:type I restriction enzyme R subunit